MAFQMAEIEYKAQRACVTLKTVQDHEGDDVHIVTDVHGEEIRCYSPNELEDVLDDILDGGYYQRAQEAADARFEELAYGQADRMGWAH